MAVVGSQPFGGEGLSGTGPKAGGPHYVKRFAQAEIIEKGISVDVNQGHARLDLQTLQAGLDQLSQYRTTLSSQAMTGPTGESNKLSVLPIGKVLCLGPTVELAKSQAGRAKAIGCEALIVCPGISELNAIDGFLPRSLLTELKGLNAVICQSDSNDLKAIRQALAARPGALVPLVCEDNIEDRCVIERHVCIDTTAAGGNVSLLASMG